MSFAMKKLYYSISEVSKITELEQYVLRYWETEFDQLKPAKNLAGNRIYTNRDIKLILQIKKLLKEQKYTIEGAKNILKIQNEKESGLENTQSTKMEIVKNKATNKFLTRSKNELSLFADSEKNKQIPEKEEIKLHKDLTELRAFLNNLLNELD
jgi:DNA-binding transcriptional MerR regulator